MSQNVLEAVVALLNKLRKLFNPIFLVKFITQKIFIAYKGIHYRKLLKNGNITLISNNCISGFLYQKYGMKYYSPTIGLQFTQEGFLKLCKNFEQYMQEELLESEDKMLEDFIKLGGSGVNFPVGKLGDITIYFQHYRTFEEAKTKWDERKSRINKNRTFFIFVGYDNTPKEIFEEYDKLPIKNKLLLTNEKIIESKNILVMKNGKKIWFDEIENSNGLKYYEQFDYYKWFMNG
jgi:uncharacterized protein (DUF1919 family)